MLEQTSKMDYHKFNGGGDEDDGWVATLVHIEESVSLK